MKKIRFGVLKVLLCVVLTLCMALPLVACKKADKKVFAINKTTGTVDVGATLLLSVTDAPGAVVWASDNEAVATVAQLSSKVDTSARVTGVSAGSATITAYSGDDTVTCTVTVTAAETITITKNGSPAPATIELSGSGDSVQLAATSSRDHAIVWESSDELIATVSSTGLVTAVAKGGTATITAKCSGTDNSGNAKASVTVKVGNGISTSYEILHDDKPVDPAKQGLWTQWSEFGNVKEATYDDGVILIRFEDNGARWVNVQLRYLPTEADNLKMGQLYKLTFDADLSFPEGFEAASGTVTVNNNKLTLNAGSGSYTVYYVQGEGLSFNMMMGYDDGSASGAWDLINATIVLSNIKWTAASSIPLVAPSFSIEGTTISIEDPNPAGSVSKYVLALYDNNNKLVGETYVTNNTAIDLSKIAYDGTVTGKLRALAASALYSDSPVATSENSTLTVNHANVNYTPEFLNGYVLAGTWVYWKESWVGFTSSYSNGILTATFSNNAGNFYDTQLIYKSLHAVGETYTIKLHINVDGNATGPDNTGRVTINGVVRTLKLGDNELSITITETSDASLNIMFGVANESNKQEIQNATVTVSIEEVS